MTCSNVNLKSQKYQFHALVYPYIFIFYVKAHMKYQICIKGIYHGYTWEGRPETTKISHLNATNFIEIS